MKKKNNTLYYPESLEIYIENGELHFVTLTSPMDILSTDNTDAISFEDAYATFKDGMTSSFAKNRYYNFTN